MKNALPENVHGEAEVSKPPLPTADTALVGGVGVGVDVVLGRGRDVAADAARAAHEHDLADARQDPRLEPPFSFAERPIRKANPGISLELQVIVETSLNYNPGDRFQSAQAMKDALIGLRRRQSGQLTKGSTGTLATVQVPVSTGAKATRGEVQPLWSFKVRDT